MNRRVDVTEVPLICRNLTIWLHVPFASQEVQLLLGKSRIYDCQWNAMEGRIPSRKERVFPPQEYQTNFLEIKKELLVWHGQNVCNMHMPPLLGGLEQWVKI